MNCRQTFILRWVVLTHIFFGIPIFLPTPASSQSSSSSTPSACPAKCLCFRTTVRCMFLQLDKVPIVPAETTVLDLRFNKIRDIPSHTFRNLKNLHTLLLNNNHITKVEDDAFKGLKELRHLYLYKNRIRTIKSNAFRGLHKLEQLYIHYNNIEYLEPGTFANMPSLERLFLHNNKLRRIPAGAFQDLTSIRRIRLDSNALICDCQIMWLADMLQKHHEVTQVAATCEFPPSLQGKSLASIPTDHFKCRKPKITEEPHDVEVTFGGTVYFTCRAEGDPAPDIVWLRNNNLLETDESGKYSILDDGTLMIKEAEDGDQGVYECMAKNPMGEVKSRPAKIHYQKDTGGEPVFIQRPSNQSVPIGATVILPCSVAGTPQPDIIWTHNGAPVSLASNRIKLSKHGSLTITNIQKSDVGTYRCVASNFLGKSFSEARIDVQAAPTFVEKPRDQRVTDGQNVEFRCIVAGHPVPEITWYKDGAIVEPYQGKVDLLSDKSILKLYNAERQDAGVFKCSARNEHGTEESSAILSLQVKVPPVFLQVPQDVNANVGENTRLPCRASGDPEPKIRWRKNDEDLELDGVIYQISEEGDLHILRVNKDDEGVYECVAENDVGFASISATLNVRDGNPSISSDFPGDPFLLSAFEKAKESIDTAINNTIQQLFHTPDGSHSAAKLFLLSRYPTPEARSLARAAEIYIRTLELVREHVDSVDASTRFNWTDEFSHVELLSPKNMELLVNLSGCLAHRRIPSCSNMCFLRKYRTYDGSCNNFQNPLWGASFTGFLRMLPPEYEDGIDKPIGRTPGRLYNGFVKPSARLVSTRVVSTEIVTEDPYVSHMLMQWGQFLDHDIDFSMPSTSVNRFADNRRCRSACDFSPPCFPIEVPPDDKRIRTHQCLEFIRSSPTCGSGLTSVFFNKLVPREQINQLTAFIDASNVYGSTERIAVHLRELHPNEGLLRHGLRQPSGKTLLPFNDGVPNDCQKDPRIHANCFLAGDFRSNEQLGLLAIHTLWFREHNRIAKELKKLNPHWSGDTIYYEARKIIGAQMQHITFSHWLPQVLGPKGMELLGPYTGYKKDVNPTVTNAFATAALRFGHTLINPILLRLDENYNQIPEGHIPLHKAFFAPQRLLEEGGIDPLLRGLYYGAAKIRKSDQLLNSELTERLFEFAHELGFDLASLNIQRSRDHGLAGYNAYRKICNLTMAKTFDDLRYEIRDAQLRAKLEELYGHPDNIDLWVGGVSEDVVPGAKVGPLFLCLLVDQFRRLRDGDRHWYENPGEFTPEQLEEIRQSSLSRVLCDSGDNITTVTKDVFVVPKKQQPHLVPCAEIKQIDLRMWVDCCHECGNTLSGQLQQHNSLQRTQRSVRVTFHRNEDEPMLFASSSNYSSNTWDGHKTMIADEAVKDSDTARDEVEKDFDITEQRIESIEEIVGQLHKTIRNLTKKVKKLESECSAKTHCRDQNGISRRDGEHWKDGPCTSCHCRKGQILCHVKVCPPVSCDKPQTPLGECCPIC